MSNEASEYESKHFIVKSPVQILSPEFWVVWVARPVLKISAILLGYATFDGIIFHIFIGKTNKKLKWLCFVASTEEKCQFWL